MLAFDQDSLDMFPVRVSSSRSGYDEFDSSHTWTCSNGTLRIWMGHQLLKEYAPHAWLSVERKMPYEYDGR